MILKKGSQGKEVKELQEFLGINADGDFGPGTEKAVKTWQYDNGLTTDGVVGPITWDLMGVISTDNSELVINTDSGLQIERYILPKGEYREGPTNKEYLFLHHTAGWHNPYNCIDAWGRDSRGTICTEFVMGGQSIKGNDDEYDGTVLQAIPEGGYGWHLGKNGSQHMHTHSVGIEVCNFGQIDNGKTWAGTKANENQIVTLAEPFRGFKTWHRYSDRQIECLKLNIEYIGNRDSIDLHEGLYKWIKESGAAGFEFNEDAYYGKVKGIITHTNTRRDKFDMFPQQELMDMILSL